MSVHPGGKQPAMHSTTWDGQVQSLVNDDGIPNGMKVILEKRGVDTKGMRAAEIKIVYRFSNCKNAVGGFCRRKSSPVYVLSKVPL